jgi:hypothetical protein
MNKILPYPPLLIALEGYSARFAPATWDALHAAHRAGAHGVQLTFWRTSDGRFCAWPGPEVDRRPIAEMSYRRIRTQYPDAADLDAIGDWAGRHGLWLVARVPEAAHLADFTLRLGAACRPYGTERVMVLAADGQALLQSKVVSPGIWTAYDAVNGCRDLPEVDWRDPVAACHGAAELERRFLVNGLCLPAHCSPAFTDLAETGCRALAEEVEPEVAVPNGCWGFSTRHPASHTEDRAAG